MNRSKEILERMLTSSCQREQNGFCLRSHSTVLTSFLEWIPSNEKEEESIKEISRLLTTVSVSSRSQYCQTSDSARYPVRNGVTFLCRQTILVETHKFISRFVRYFEIELDLISIELLGQVQGQKSRISWNSFETFSYAMPRYMFVPSEGWESHHSLFLVFWPML